MKKILTTIAFVGAALGAFAQGSVNFENDVSSGNVQFVGGPTPSAAVNGGYDVALLYSATTTGLPLAQSSLTQVGFFAVTPGGQNGPGYFTGPTVITPANGLATFEVVGWSTGGSQTAYTSWASVLAAGGAGLTYWTTGANLVEFVNNQGSPDGSPASPAINLSGNGGTWTGNLVLTPVPEPTTIALGGLGAAALMLFRRRK